MHVDHNNFYSTVINNVLDNPLPFSPVNSTIWNIVCNVFAHLADKFLSLISTSYCEQKKKMIYQKNRASYLKQQEEAWENARRTWEQEEFENQGKQTTQGTLTKVTAAIKGAAYFPVKALFGYYNSPKVSDKDKIKGGYAVVAGSAIGTALIKRAGNLYREGEKWKAVKVGVTGALYPITGALVTAMNHIPTSWILGK